MTTQTSGAAELGKRLQNIEDLATTKYEALRDDLAESREETQKSLASLEETMAAVKATQEAMTNQPDFSNFEVGEKKGQISNARLLQLVVTARFEPEQHGKLWGDTDYGPERELFEFMWGLRDMDGAEVVRKQYGIQSKAEITAATGSGGGFLIPLTMPGGMLPYLEAASVLPSLGVPIFNDAVGDISLVKESTTATAYYVDSEAAEAITESAPAFENIKLTPHTLGALVPSTRKTWRNAIPSLGNMLMERLATRLGKVEDQKYFLGSGSDSEPLGVKNEDGIISVNFDAGGAMTVGPTADSVSADLVEMLRQVENTNVNMQTAAWAAGVNTKYCIGRVQDANGREKYTENVHRERTGPQPGGLMVRGYPLFSSASLNNASQATDELFFGDWKERPVWRWGAIELEAATQHSDDWAKGRVSIKATLDHDFLSLTDGFAKATNFDSSTANA